MKEPLISLTYSEYVRLKRLAERNNRTIRGMITHMLDNSGHLDPHLKG